jgi:hypothetical protein
MDGRHNQVSAHTVVEYRSDGAKDQKPNAPSEVHGYASPNQSIPSAIVAKRPRFLAKGPSAQNGPFSVWP